MPNPYVNKVQKADGTVIMDISEDTVTASDVVTGKTFHDRSGTPQQGSLVTASIKSVSETVQSNINGNVVSSVSSDKAIIGVIGTDGHSFMVSGTYANKWVFDVTKVVANEASPILAKSESCSYIAYYIE